MEITSSNFPEEPDYLAPGHMPDEDLWAIIAYLKNGVRALSNTVEDTDRPPEGWASDYADGKIGTYPAPPFPTANEVGGEAPEER
jgi:hypothetical protein